jgi:DNA-binding MarR family transcriptional regulator
MTTGSRRVSADADLADQLFDLMKGIAKHVDARLEDVGLTTTDYWAIKALDKPMPMSELAHCMEFDPSYVTSLADRLEQLGLVERQAHPTDRRVKHLALTANGRKIRSSFPDRLWSNSEMFSALSPAEHARFSELLNKIQGSDPA